MTREDRTADYFERIWFYFYRDLPLDQKARFMQTFPLGIDPVLQRLRDAPTSLEVAVGHEQAAQIEAAIEADPQAREFLDANKPSSEYQRGRESVLRELGDAVDRYNADDTLGMGDLIDVIAPWLRDAPTPEPVDSGATFKT